jgi:hypothetical protein
MLLPANHLHIPSGTAVPSQDLESSNAHDESQAVIRLESEAEMKLNNDRLVLDLVPEFGEIEAEFEGYRCRVEGAEEAIRRWSKVERSCTEKSLNDCRDFAQERSKRHQGLCPCIKSP